MSDIRHAPPRPGDVLQRTVLDHMNITQDKLARALGVSRHTVNLLLNGRRAVTPEMALRLARVLGTSAEMWLNLQLRLDLYEAELEIGDELSELICIRKPKLFDPKTVK